MNAPLKSSRWMICGVVLAMALVCGTQCGNKSSQNWSNGDIRWYQGPGAVTANGERFDPNSLTYASKWHPFGTNVDIVWKNRIITARCNDRGPNEVELTKGAFSQLEDINVGVLHDAKFKINK